MSGENPNPNDNGSNDDYLARLRDYTSVENPKSEPYVSSSTESLGSVTNQVVTPGQNVELSGQGYNASTEQTAATQVVETAKQVGDASVHLQEIEARIKGNTGASTMVMKAAIAAIGGIKSFVEGRGNANIAAARRDVEKWNGSSYPSKVAKQSQAVGERASQFITQQGNAARAQEQLNQVGQNNMLGRTAASANELFKNIANNRLERSVSKSERLERTLAARRWRSLLAKEERHINRAKFYQNLSKTLGAVMVLFANHGDLSMQKIAEQREAELAAQLGEKKQNVTQANEQYGNALQRQMNASYSGR